MMPSSVRHWRRLVFVLVGVLTADGRYDARQRAFLRRLAEAYDLPWAQVRAAEGLQLEQLVRSPLRSAPLCLSLSVRPTAWLAQVRAKTAEAALVAAVRGPGLQVGTPSAVATR